MLQRLACPRRAQFTVDRVFKKMEKTGEQELVFDAINDNLPEIVEKYGNNSRKITCDYYIDDRAVLPESLYT